MICNFFFNVRNCVLFGDYPWNQIEDLPGNVKRAKDWDEAHDLVHHFVKNFKVFN